MYVKATNGSLDQYPYTIGQLRRDNPNTSFPKQISLAVLESYGVYPVVEKEAPVFNQRTQRVLKDTSPSLVAGEWVIDWTISDKSTTQIAQYDAGISEENRTKRNMLLSASDWTQVADAPVDATAWATYRQALRDITTHTNWPHLSESDWPVKP